MSESYACSLDLGTMNLCSSRDSDDGKEVITNSIRDCYREIPYLAEFETALREQNAAYMRDGKNLYVLGDDAYLQASMVEFAQGQSGDTSEILKRPMKDGILNPDSPKLSLTILRQLMKSCIEGKIGPARKNEVLFFSIPANPVDSPLNNVFHEKMAERYLSSLGFYEVHSLNEAMAVVFAENPTMSSSTGEIIPYSGIGLSMGSGQCNFCLAHRGISLDGFSVCRAGDWLDSQAARMVGEPKTKIMRIKESKLDFNHLDESDEILLALDVYYEELLNYVFGHFKARFSRNKSVLELPVEIVVAGGTASCPGFDKKLERVLSKMDLPFEIKGIRLAGGGDKAKMLQAVSKGCYAKAKSAAQKATHANDVLNEI